MKKEKIGIYIITLLAVIALVSYSHKPETEMKPIANSVYKPPEGSREELNQDIYVTLLMPYINKALDGYYKEYFKGIPHEDPWSVGIINIERPNGDRTTLFIIELEVMPYVGPHINVGRDRITLRVQSGSEPEIEKFEHLESFPLPPDYQSIIRHKWPPQ